MSLISLIRRSHLSTLTAIVLIVVSFLLVNRPVYGEKIIPCNGIYAAKQDFLSGHGEGQGFVIQGAKSLGNIEIKVLSCGEKLSLLADGQTIILKRSTTSGNKYSGSRKGSPNLKFTLNIESSKKIKGGMIASGDGLTMKRPLVLSLISGKSPDLNSCQGEPPSKIMHMNSHALSKVLLDSKITPAQGFSYVDYIKEGVEANRQRKGVYGTEYYKSHSISILIDKVGSIIPDLSDAKESQGGCLASPKPSLHALATHEIKILINQYQWTIEMSVVVRDLINGKEIIEQYSESFNGRGQQKVKKLMKKLWKKVKLPVLRMSDGKATK